MVEREVVSAISHAITDGFEFASFNISTPACPDDYLMKFPDEESYRNTQ